MRAAHDVVIRGGTIYDGTGGAPLAGDVAIDGDRIAEIGKVGARARSEIDAGGLAVAPGFINMLSWATTSLIADGRSQSDIRQGVTCEVFGEGWSLGPVNETMRREQTEQQGDIKYDITWTTLAEAVDEVIEIARRARLPAEIYHLKQAGRSNWDKLDAVIDRVTRARAGGLAITADMYPYEAGATGLSSCFPPWAHEGGLSATLARL